LLWLVFPAGARLTETDRMSTENGSVCQTVDKLQDLSLGDSPSPLIRAVEDEESDSKKELNDSYQWTLDTLPIEVCSIICMLNAPVLMFGTSVT